MTNFIVCKISWVFILFGFFFFVVFSPSPQIKTKTKKKTKLEKKNSSLIYIPHIRLIELNCWKYVLELLLFRIVLIVDGHMNMTIFHRHSLRMLDLRLFLLHFDYCCIYFYLFRIRGLNKLYKYKFISNYHYHVKFIKIIFKLVSMSCVCCKSCVCV